MELFGQTIAIAIAFACLLWLAVMPREARGKVWHVTHAAIPPLAITAYFLLPAGPLTEACRLWLISGAWALLPLGITWVIGTITRNHGFMDVTYPLAPAFMAWVVFFYWRPHISASSIALLVMVSTWAIRLSVQTYWQNHAVEREPYATWRTKFGSKWSWWSIFQVYLLQGCFFWVWGMSFAFAISAPTNWLTIALGSIIWLVGFSFQSGSDRQLAAFKRNPANRGKILNTGFWKIVRQPNYFGESTMWFGYAILALAHPWGFIALLGPLYNAWFMGFGSAGRFKEQHMARTRGEEWAQYCAVTPRFFPWAGPR